MKRTGIVIGLAGAAALVALVAYVWAGKAGDPRDAPRFSDRDVEQIRRMERVNALNEQMIKEKE